MLSRLLKFLLLLMGTLGSTGMHADASLAYYVKDCGELEVVGSLHCDLSGCKITLFPESQAETDIYLSPTKLPISAYDKLAVVAEIDLPSRTLPLKGKLLSVRSALSTEFLGARDQVKIQKKADCRP